MLFLAGLSPLSLAMTLGSGQMLNHVGEPLRAHIALVGSYNSEVHFFQVGLAECKSSMIAAGVNGCDALYEGNLKISVELGQDGARYLRLNGNKSDELFYHILIKSVDATGGTVFNSFEFLPEFVMHSDVPVVESDGAPEVTVSKRGAAAEVMAKAVAPREPVQPVFKAYKDKEPLSVENTALHEPKPVEVKPEPPTAQLKIKKLDEYADDIHALQKENEEIEAQIVLMEKYIGMLKEVIRLKRQAGDSAAAPATAAMPSIQPHAGESAILIWGLLALVAVLLGLLVWMYRKQQGLKLNEVETHHNVAFPFSVPVNEMKSLDLTSAFRTKKW